MDMYEKLVPYNALKPCPMCGGQPTVETEQWGHAYFVLCGSCGWEGDWHEVESTPSAALSHWSGKFEV